MCCNAGKSEPVLRVIVIAAARAALGVSAESPNAFRSAVEMEAASAAARRATEAGASEDDESTVSTSDNELSEAEQ